MIDVSELRVGNWFDFPFVGRAQATKEDIGNWEAQAASSIPLTPEILEACGFEKKKNVYIIVPDLILALDSYWWWSDCWQFDDSNEYETISPWREVKSLHQLQNLYFALTGKELNFSLAYPTTPAPSHKSL